MKYEQIKIILNLNLSLEEKSYQIFLMSLSSQMRNIFLHIPKGIENAVGIKQLKILTGIQGKNISSQIKNIQKRFPIKEKGDRIKLYYV